MAHRNINHIIDFLNNILLYKEVPVLSQLHGVSYNIAIGCFLNSHFLNLCIPSLDWTEENHFY